MTTVKKMMLEKYDQRKEYKPLIFEYDLRETVEESGGGTVETEESPEDEEDVDTAMMMMGTLGTETVFYLR